MSLELFLLIIILILCIFNAISIFIIGGVIARNREDIIDIASVMTSIPTQEKNLHPRGRRYDIEGQLEDVQELSS